MSGDSNSNFNDKLPMLHIYSNLNSKSNRKNNTVDVKPVQNNVTEQIMANVKPDIPADSSLHWWLLYFKLSYYICITPYRIQARPLLKSRTEPLPAGTEESALFLHKCKIQKILHCIFQTVSILTGCMYFETSSGKNTVRVQYSATYFGYAAQLGNMVYRIAFAYVFWRRGNSFVNILTSVFERNCTQEKTVSNCTYRRRKSHDFRVNVLGHTVSAHLSINRMKAILIAVVYVCVGCNTFCSYIKTHYWGKDLHQIIERSREILNSYLKSISAPVSFDTENFNISGVTYFEIFAHIFLFVGISYTNFLYKAFSLFSLLTLLFYGQLVNEFSERFLKPWDARVEEVVVEFRWFQGLVQEINFSISEMMLFEIVGTLPYYVETIPIIITSATPFGSSDLRHSFYCLCYFSLIFIGARQFHKLDDGMKSWISRPQTFEKLPEKELQIILFELNCNNNSTALRVMGSYVINYSLLGSVVSVVITYTIISLQLRSSGANLDSGPG